MSNISDYPEGNYQQYIIPTTQELLDIEVNITELVEDDMKFISSEGYKEHANKTDYSEIDFAFLTQLARRMNKNKGKYPKNNWKKPIDVEKLKQAMFRHVISVMQGEYRDDGRDQGHLEAIALGAMMINYQLKHHKNGIK